METTRLVVKWDFLRYNDSNKQTKERGNVKEARSSEKGKVTAGKPIRDWHVVLPYINIFLLTTVLFIIIYKLNWQTNMKRIQHIMLAGVILIVAGFGVYTWKKGFSVRVAILSLLAAGFIMRIGYMLYTPAYVRSHDIGEFKLDGYGHAAYIFKLMVNHKLPETNWVQFYHPPLYHFLAACMCSVIRPIMHYTTFEETLEGAKIVSCVAGCWSLMLMPKICTELNLKDRAKIIAVAIIAFFPDCFLVGGRVNNDSLVTFFMMLAILYTIKWYKEQSWTNTIVLALAFGLGMMTKTSCGNIALFTGAIMLYVFYKSIRSKNWVGLFAKLCGFGAIVFPLGLWYIVRNYLKFKQPFGYVVDIGKDSDIYTGAVSFFDRFIQFPFMTLTKPTFAHPWDDFNIPVYVLKSAMFGEFEYQVTEFIPHALVLVSFVLVLISLFAMIYQLIKCKENVMLRFGMPVLWLIVYGTFLFFNYKYPYGCTMDYRYILPTAYLGALFIGSVFEKSCVRKSERAIVFRIVSVAATGLFAMFSVLFFCFIQ